ncbi:MAG: AIR synthase-related protein, partial [Paracoccaceae bacterium]
REKPLEWTPVEGSASSASPGLYAEGDLDLAGFAVGAMERGGALPRPARPGDALLALPSTGVHSNGFSLVRRIVERTGADLAAPAPFDASRSLAAALLTPTALYPAPVRAVRAAAGEGLRALAHVTGGGLPENLPRALPEGLGAALDPWPLPPVFRWLANAGGVAEAEMLRVFNCGVGLVLVLAPQAEEAARDALPEAFRLGVVTETPGVALSAPLA